MNGFTFRYAIRMPNGQLFAAQKQRPADFEREHQRAYLSMLGMHVLESEMEPQPAPEPLIFDQRDDAEKILTNLRESARQFGVDNYGATIVAQLCTPFTPGDPGMEFADDIIKWIGQEGIEP